MLLYHSTCQFLHLTVLLRVLCTFVMYFNIVVCDTLYIFYNNGFLLLLTTVYFDHFLPRANLWEIPFAVIHQKFRSYDTFLLFAIYIFISIIFYFLHFAFYFHLLYFLFQLLVSTFLYIILVVST